MGACRKVCAVGVRVAAGATSGRAQLSLRFPRARRFLREEPMTTREQKATRPKDGQWELAKQPRDVGHALKTMGRSRDS